MNRIGMTVALFCFGAVLATGLYLRQSAAMVGGACASTAFFPFVVVLRGDPIEPPALGSPLWHNATYVRCRLLVVRQWRPEYADVTYLLNRRTHRPIVMWRDP